MTGINFRGVGMGPKIAISAILDIHVNVQLTNMAYTCTNSYEISGLRVVTCSGFIHII